MGPIAAIICITQWEPGHTEVLNDIRPGSPVFLTKNGRGRYVVDIQEYEKNHAALKLMSELEKGRVSGEKEGWSTIDEARKKLDVV
jgi:hypothetical protein